MSIRPLHQSVRPSPIFLAIVAITAVGGVLAWLAADERRRPLAYVGVFIFVIAGWLVSLCLHEFAPRLHRVAVRRPRRRGARLPDAEPAEVLASAAVARAAGAVHRARRHRPARRRGVRADVVHDASGRRPWSAWPGRSTNLVFAVRAAGADRGCSTTRTTRCSGPGMAFLGFLQVTALVLNLLPVPGLDGYSALEPHLSPRDAARPAARQAVGVLHPAVPAVRAASSTSGSSGVVYWFFELSGVPDGAGRRGHAAHPVLVRLVLSSALRHMRLYA